MVKLLAKIFIKNNTAFANPATRRAYGLLCGALGICLNLVLFFGKFFAGVLSSSLAIMADAFNNLSDAASSLVTLLGFKLAAAEPDKEHPFGHGRIEYLSGMAVSIFILLMGFEIGRTAIGKVLHPAPVTFGLLQAGVLLCSIAVKLYMYFYNRHYAGLLNSSAMLATGLDSLSDCAATGALLFALACGKFTGLQVDGWVSLLVAAFVFKTGFSALKSTAMPLLGQAPAPELVKAIEETVLAAPAVLGMHDLILHDYGPGRMILSLHAEVDGAGDIFAIHDEIDNVENQLAQKFNCTATIHMDPIDIHNTRLNGLRSAITALLQAEIDPALTIHDLRMVPGPTHTNLVFDIVAPTGFKTPSAALAKQVKELVQNLDGGDYRAVVTVDVGFV